jgi:hypothetical protein
MVRNRMSPYSSDAGSPVNFPVSDDRTPTPFCTMASRPPRPFAKEPSNNRTAAARTKTRSLRNPPFSSVCRSPDTRQFITWVIIPSSSVGSDNERVPIPLRSRWACAVPLPQGQRRRVTLPSQRRFASRKNTTTQLGSARLNSHQGLPPRSLRLPPNFPQAIIGAEFSVAAGSNQPRCANRRSGHGHHRFAGRSLMSRLPTATGWCSPALPAKVYERSNPLRPSTFISQLSFVREPTMDTRQSPGLSLRTCSTTA